MKVELLRANIGDAKELHAMQVKAFKELQNQCYYIHLKRETPILS